MSNAAFLRFMCIFMTIAINSLAENKMPDIASYKKSIQRLCPKPWRGADSITDSDCELVRLRVKIRAGYLPENPNVPFKGNVIYYEGLGDSMLNHLPLFKTLTESGYRVIAFDYMGQGGSSGSMDDTRIKDIGYLGNQIWRRFARDLDSFPKRNIIGWSTGGLAAFVQAANEQTINKIILIAPGIAPKSLVGEQHPFLGKIDLITLATLTTRSYTNGLKNPHVDPIKPTSPLEVKRFAFDLQLTALQARHHQIDKRIRGFVLLSGKEDTYVDAEKTRKILLSAAPHFQIKQYGGALHEIDNESEPNGSASHYDILDFLNSN